MAQEQDPIYEIEIVYSVGKSQYKITAFGPHSAFLVQPSTVREIELTRISDEPLKLRLQLKE